VAEVAAYAMARAMVFDNAPSLQEAAIVRATAYIDARYGARFPGTKSKNRDQSLRWPRWDALDAEGVLIRSDEVPTEIKAATCEAAIRELAAPGALQPDYERGGQIKSLQAGSVQVVYADGATPETVMTSIDNALAGILAPRRAGSITFGKVVRG
jgi:hypothetical protein